jgi:hypothetical protein
MAPRSLLSRACIAERVEHVGYLLREGLGDVEVVAADIEEGAVVAEAVLEGGKIVADAVEGAEPPDEAEGDLLAEIRWGSRPKLHSGHCRVLPHGGRQLSWYFGDNSHGDGLTEGLDNVRQWVQLEIVLLGHQRFTQV